MMNLERLRALHALATFGSVSAAAEALHVTAPAISQQLGKLEREVGQRLIERHGRGVRLTDAAVRLAGHTDEILSLMERAEADLEAHRDCAVGKLTVAAFPTAARGLGAAALGILRDQHPQLDIELNEQEPESALAMLNRGEADLVISQDWEGAPLPVPDTLQRRPLLDDIADIALPYGHRLATRDVVHLSDVANEPWISWPRGCMCRGWMVQTLRSMGAEPRIVHTANEHATQLELVAAGFGVAVIPRMGNDQVPSGVRLIALRPELRRHVYALWRADAARRPAIRAAVDGFAAAGRRFANASGPATLLVGAIRPRHRRRTGAAIETGRPG